MKFVIRFQKAYDPRYVLSLALQNIAAHATRNYRSD